MLDPIYIKAILCLSLNNVLLAYNIVWHIVSFYAGRPYTFDIVHSILYLSRTLLIYKNMLVILNVYV